MAALMSTSAIYPPSTPFPDLLGTFSNVSHADIILRSSDSYEFKVQKFYMIDSSPVLGKQIMAVSRHVAGPESKPHFL